MTPEMRPETREHILRQRIRDLQRSLDEAQEDLRLLTGGEIPTDGMADGKRPPTDAAASAGPKDSGNLPPVLAEDGDGNVEVIRRSPTASVLGQVHAPLFATDLDGRITGWNEGARRLLGYDTDDIVGRDLSFLLFDQSSGELDFQVLESLRDAGTLEREVQLRCKAGAVKSVRLSLSVLRDDLWQPSGLIVLAIDLTDQKKAEQFLRESEDRYRILADVMPQIAYVTDAQGRALMVNQRWTEYTGVPAAAALNFDWLSMVHPDDRAIHQERFLECIRSGAMFENEYRVRDRYGVYRWHLARTVPVRREDGSVLQWVGTSTDLHEQTVAAIAMRASEERLRLAFRAIQGTVFDWDVVNGRVYVVNIEGLIGKPAHEIGSDVEGFRALVHPDDLANSTFGVGPRLEHHQRLFETEFRVRHADGHWIHVLDRCYLIRDENGRPVRVVGSGCDVTERRRLELELEQTNKRLRFQADILANTNDAVIGLDDREHVTYFNAAAERLYGVAASEVLGKPIGEVHEHRWLDPEDEPRAWAELIENGHWKGESIHVRKDGSEIVVSSTVNRLGPEAGGGTIGIIRDVSERRRSEVENQTRAAELVRANEDLLHFAYAVSHDLQAPLRTVTTFSQLLQLKYRKALDGQGDEIVAGIVQASNRMGTMIRDLLEFAKVAGSESRAAAEVPVSAALASALESLRGAIEESGAEISYDALPVVYGEASELAQVFQNLIGNSLKYRKPDTPPRVRISAERQGSEWVITARDNGIGFDSKYASQIFEAFQRLHGSEFSGTGIGLTICQRIVERQGGRIWAEGTPGEGAAFSFTLRAERPRESHGPISVPQREGAWALTAEGDLSNQGLFDELFQTLNLAQAIVRRLDGTIITWTKGAERLFGYSQVEAAGQRVQDLIDKRFPQPQREIEAHLLTHGEWAGQIEARTKDGSRIWLASHFSLYRDGSGRPQSIIEVHNGINELKEAEAAFLRTSQLRDLALRAGQLGVWRRDLFTGTVHWDSTLQRILGWTPDTFAETADFFFGLVHPGDRGEVRARVDEAIEKQQDFHTEYRARHHDGSYRWIRSQGRPVYDERQQPVALIGVAWDFTASKQAALDQEFLLELGNELSRCSDSGQLADIATKRLAGYLEVSRCVYTEIDWQARRAQRISDYHPAGASVLGNNPLAMFDRVVSEMEQGHYLAVSDVETDPLTAQEFENVYLRLGARALLSVPLHREGLWVANLSVGDHSVRKWVDREVILVRSVAERLWPAMENARLLRELREQGEQLRGTFEQAAVGIAHVGLDGRWLNVNDTICEITGYSREELLALTFQDITHPDDLESDLNEYAALKRGEIRSYTIEKRYISKSGSVVWINLTVSLIRDNSGNPKYAISVVEDITARKWTESLLNDSIALAETRLQEIEAIYSGAPVGLALVDRDLRYIRINEHLARMNNLTVGEHLGRTISEVLPQLAGQVEPLYRSVMETGVTLQNVEVQATAAGSLTEATWLTSYFPFRDRYGAIAGVNVVVQDITERKQTEILWLEAAEKLHVATSSARLGVFTWDPQNDRVVWENKRMYELTGRRREDGPINAEEFCRRIVHSEDRLEFERDLAEATRRGDTFHRSCRIRRLDGESRWVELSGQFEGGPEGKPKRLIGVMADITDRVEAQRVLLDEREHLRRVLDTLFIFVGVLSPDGVLLEANAAPLQAAGIQAEDVIGKPFAETYWWSWSAEVQNQVRTAIHRAKLGISSRFDVQVRVRDGMMTIDFALAPMRDAGGEIKYLIPSAVPIDERKQMETALRASEERARLMLDSIYQLAWMAEADGYIFWYNRRWYEYTGTNSQQMEGWGWQAVHDPEYLPRVMEGWTESIRNGVPFEMEFPLRGADGIFRPFLTRVFPVRDAEGRVFQWFGTNTNIEALRKEQDVLRESERKYRELAETLPQLIWEADPRGEIVYCNPQWYAYTGVPPAVALNDRWLGVIHPEEAAPVFQAWDTAIATGQRFEQETRIRRHDGAFRWFLNRALPVKDQQGRVLKWLGTSIDIHEQKLTEQALRHSNEDLEQFAYAASHELREPLRTMATYTQLLDQKYRGAGEPAERYVSYIVGAAKRMDRLLTALVDYSRAGGPTGPLAPIGTEEILKMVLRELDPEIAGCGAIITHDPLPVVLCQPIDLLQVLQHLIANTIKYRASRTLRVHLSASRIGMRYQFAIADNGIGMKDEYLEKIFGMFKRLHNDEYPGVGVGLAICKRIVERNGGRIWAESEFGHGTTFYFTLPSPDQPVI